MTETAAPEAPPPPEDTSTLHWESFAKSLVTAIIQGPLPGFLQDIFDRVIPQLVALQYATAMRLRGELVKTIGVTQGKALEDAGPLLAELGAIGISQLFETPVEATEVRTGVIAPSGPELHERLGHTLMTQLFGAITEGKHVGPETGMENAENLISVLLGYGVKGWLQTHLGNHLFTEFLEGWGGLEESVERSIGFSRLSRRALAPILNALIATPLSQQLARTYKQNLPSSAQLLSMLQKGWIGETEYFGTMELLGYTHEWAAGLRRAGEKDLGTANVQKLLQLGRIDEGAARVALEAEGYSAPDAADLVDTFVLDRVLPLQNEIASTARSMFAAREIDEQTLDQMLLHAGFAEEERQLALASSQLTRSRPARLSDADIEAAYLVGIVDSNRLRLHYATKGYSDDDAGVLVALAAGKALKAAQAAEGARPPREVGQGVVLDEATVLELHRRGLIPTETLTGKLGELGFKGDNLAAVVVLAEAKRAEYAAAVAKHAAPKAGITPKPGKIEDAFFAGLIDATQLGTFYLEAGFSPLDVPLLVTLREHQKAEKAPKGQPVAGASSSSDLISPT